MFKNMTKSDGCLKPLMILMIAAMDEAQGNSMEFYEILSSSLRGAAGQKTMDTAANLGDCTQKFAR